MPTSSFDAGPLPTQDGTRIVLHRGSGARLGAVAGQAAMEAAEAMSARAGEVDAPDLRGAGAADALPIPGLTRARSFAAGPGAGAMIRMVVAAPFTDALDGTDRGRGGGDRHAGLLAHAGGAVLAPRRSMA